jgi:heptosyltransferase-2
MTARRYLVIHTAFLGDIVLLLPLLQALRQAGPGSFVAVLTTPAASGLLEGHPAVNEVIPYAKRTTDRGIRGIFRIADRLEDRAFDVAIIPHRSLRSAVVGYLSNTPVRIGFDRSAGKFLLTSVVQYRPDAHEIDRNIDLLAPLGFRPADRLLPVLPPNPSLPAGVQSLLDESKGRRTIAIAPGSVWMTKRWPADRFALLAAQLEARGDRVVLLGSAVDRQLCGAVAAQSGRNPLNLAGMLSLRESAEVIRTCDAIVTNDSAPAHLGVAVGTRVIAIFGATSPAFGFAPAGPHDVIVETNGLACRPCAIHGGNSCPIQTFVCMLSISPEQVLAAIDAVPSDHH